MAGRMTLTAQLLLKGAEHSVVVEGAALYHDVLAQLVGGWTARMTLYMRVLDDGDGQTGGDVLHRWRRPSGPA